MATPRQVDRDPLVRSPTPMPSLFPILLATHVTLAIALFVPGLVLPFTLRGRQAVAEPGRTVRGLLWVQAHGTLIIGAGLAVTGVAMVLALGTRLLEEPWLLVALATYGVTAAVVFFVQRPRLQDLLGRGQGRSDEDRQAWRAGARRQRYLAYGVTTAVGLIAFLMSTKPALW
jgi:hypothetical protein